MWIIITWTEPSWKICIYDVNSYLFAHTLVITIDLDQIKCPAELQAKNHLGVYNISYIKVALLDSGGMSTSRANLAYDLR